uniref:Uncharacterized protein n=1 Tax=Onchocerca volvulus TaxID=6282 RepID=A0A8R1TSZ9_ONCVO
MAAIAVILSEILHFSLLNLKRNLYVSFAELISSVLIIVSKISINMIIFGYMTFWGVNVERYQ